MVNPIKNLPCCRMRVTMAEAGQKLPFDVTWPDAARAQRHRMRPVPRCGPWGRFSTGKGPKEIRSSKTDVTLTFCRRWGLKPPQKKTSGQLICFCFAKRTVSKNTWCFSRQTLEFDEQEMCFNDQTWWGSYMVLPCFSQSSFSWCSWRCLIILYNIIYNTFHFIRNDDAT